MTSHSHHTDRANTTGGVGSKITKQDVRGCLSTAGLPRDCGNITLYYQYYSKQEGQEMWLLYGEKVLIREM